MKTSISEYLKRFIGQEIYYCPNPGNAGDGIIAHATFQVMKNIGLTVKEISTDTTPEQTRGNVVIYGGGGNLVEPYPNAKIFIERHHAGAKELIVLPHTILSYPELLNSLGGNVTLFCREQESYDYVARNHGSAAFYLSDDMALSMNVEQTLADGRERFLPIISSKSMITRNAKRVVRHMIYAIKNWRTPSTLYAFRDDVEKTNFMIPNANIDLSQAFSGDGITEWQSHEVTYRVLRFINRYKSVHTNRLHVGIASLLMGKKVYFYDNSYGKNRFVYENSLKDRFKNVVWRGNAINID